MWSLYNLVVIQIEVKISVTCNLCMIKFLLFVLPEHLLSYIIYMYFQLVINYYICDGRGLSIKYHISGTLLYIMGHR